MPGKMSTENAIYQYTVHGSVQVFYHNCLNYNCAHGCTSLHESLEGHHSICSIFFDLRKAFNTVPHHKLVDRLESLGLNFFKYTVLMDACMQSDLCIYMLFTCILI